MIGMAEGRGVLAGMAAEVEIDRDAVLQPVEGAFQAPRIARGVLVRGFLTVFDLVRGQVDFLLWTAKAMWPFQGAREKELVCARISRCKVLKTASSHFPLASAAEGVGR